MAEYIDCRDCTSPDCKGCNLKNLETMLKSGKFDCLINGNRCISVDADVAPVRHGQWIKGKSGIYECSYCGKSAPYSNDSEYLIEYWPALNYCPNCGAQMNGERKEGAG